MSQIVSHRARLVMQAPGRWVPNGVVTVSGETIVSVEARGKKSPPGRLLDHGSGILMPALVNAHTHLTLSALKGKVDCGRGFIHWVESLLETRKRLCVDEARQSAQEAICTLKKEGVGLVGEFGPFFPLEDILLRTRIEGVIWQEFLGGDQELPTLANSHPGIVLSYAGHAPHTTSPRLLKRLKELCSELGLFFCMHLAESEEETEFLERGDGLWAEFLRSRGLDFSGWDCFGRRPVELALKLGVVDHRTLLVHLLQATSEDIGLLVEVGAKVCVCPRSNFTLHRALPRLEEFLRAGLKPALGTDSLASVDSLSMFEEMGFLAQNFPTIDPATILQMATVNGAMALGRTDLGVLEKGRSAKMIYVELEAPDTEIAQERLVSGISPIIRPAGW